MLLRWTALLGEAASVDTLAGVSGTAPQDVLAGVGRMSALGLADQDAGLVRLRYPLLRCDVAATSVGLRVSVARRLADHGVPAETVVGLLAGAAMDAWTMEWLGQHADRLAVRLTPAVLDVLSRAAAWLPPGDVRQPAIRAALAEALL
ncbi:hypothetical protein [Kitasatospora sp. NPDC056531]|uniref:hypothetical protein n=1 Tax=Kitasatospora sp. NPDC056531 TaxID=3345856 RepID=UPI0036AEC41E